MSFISCPMALVYPKCWARHYSRVVLWSIASFGLSHRPNPCYRVPVFNLSPRHLQSWGIRDCTFISSLFWHLREKASSALYDCFKSSKPVLSGESLRTKICMLAQATFLALSETQFMCSDPKKKQFPEDVSQWCWSLVNCSQFFGPNWLELSMLNSKHRWPW